MEHKLKIQSQYLENLMLCNKKAEIRLNDRDYQVGDILTFFDADAHAERHFKVTHIHSGLGLEPNYVVLSVSQLK